MNVSVDTVKRSPLAESVTRLLRSSLRVGGLLATIVLIGVVFTILNASFLTASNLLELIRAMSSLAIVALGETLVIIANELDLSVGAVYGLAVFRGQDGTTIFGNIPIQVLWLIGLALVMGGLLHRSLSGLRLIAIGGNADAARLAKLAVTKYKWIVFIIGGFLAALAGTIASVVPR